MLSTYLYSDEDSKRRNRPSPIKIANYEKTTIDRGYTPKFEDEKSELLRPAQHMSNGLTALKVEGLSTSRPSSPMRHHSRVGTGSKGRMKRDD